ncbi:MAG: hypothetical protein GC137_04560 [Alphaproteobacteria bacterium]|nr:hypothetical protein [Alphaproteobacteria bacterium]
MSLKIIFHERMAFYAGEGESDPGLHAFRDLVNEDLIGAYQTLLRGETLGAENVKQGSMIAMLVDRGLLNTGIDLDEAMYVFSSILITEDDPRASQILYKMIQAGAKHPNLKGFPQIEEEVTT